MTKNWFLSCTALTLSLAAAPAVSWAQSVEPVDVPAQTLADALAELGRETGLQISVRTGLVEGKTSTAVQGDLTPQSALEILLSGTGLTYSAIGEDGVVIAQAAPELETDETGALVLDEIIVQGERVARSLFETSSSVSVVTGERIEQQRTVRDARQAVRLLPNVFDEDGTNNSATIRGLDSTGPSTGAGAFIGGARPRGSVVVDGRSLSSLELSFSEVSVWDVEQIEAFNGPQTTTNGTNSLAGATFIKTRDPSFEVEGALRVYAGNFATNGIAAMVNLPIVEDQIAFRGTFDVEHQNVWRNAVLAPPNDNLDNNERINIRAKMLFEPEILPELSSLFTFNYSEDSGPQTLLSDAPFRLRESNAPLEASFNNNYLSFINETSYAFTDNIVLTNTFQMSDNETDREAPDGTISLFAEEFGNETRVNFEALDGDLTGVFGAAWLLREEELPFQLGPISAQISGSTESFGVFGELTYSVTDKAHLTAGGRFQLEKSQREIPDIPGLLPGGIDFDETFTAFLPKVAASYDVTDEVRVGALVSRGFNPGGVSQVLGLGIFEYDEESVWNFEAFTRASLFDDRLQLSANAFYTRVEDYQVFTTVDLPGLPSQVKVENAERVRTYGLDLTASVQPIDDLFVDATLGLLQTKIKEFSISVEDVIGNELSRAPNVTFSLGAQYDVTDALRVGSSFRYVGPYFGGEENLASGEAGNYAVVDLNAGYQLHENFEIFASVTNLFDSDYTVQAFGTGNGRRVGLGDPLEFVMGGELRF